MKLSILAFRSVTDTHMQFPEGTLNGMVPIEALTVGTLCPDKQGWQRAKASMRLRIRGATSGDASLSSATAGGDQQRGAADVSSQVSCRVLHCQSWSSMPPLYRSVSLLIRLFPEAPLPSDL